MLVILGNLNKSGGERRAEIVLIMESPQIGPAEPLPYLALRLRCDPSLFVGTQLARVSQSRPLRDVPASIYWKGMSREVMRVHVCVWTEGPPAGKCEVWGKNKHGGGGVQIGHASSHISEHNLSSSNASARILVYPGELPCRILHAPEIDFLRIGL